MEHVCLQTLRRNRRKRRLNSHHRCFLKKTYHGSNFRLSTKLSGDPEKKLLLQFVAPRKFVNDSYALYCFSHVIENIEEGKGLSKVLNSNLPWYVSNFVTISVSES